MDTTKDPIGIIFAALDMEIEKEQKQKEWFPENPVISPDRLAKMKKEEETQKAMVEMMAMQMLFKYDDTEEFKNTKFASQKLNDNIKRSIFLKLAEDLVMYLSDYESGYAGLLACDVPKEEAKDFVERCLAFINKEMAPAHEKAMQMIEKGVGIK